MRKAFYLGQSRLYSNNVRTGLEDLAHNLELDLPLFNTCLDNNTHADAICADFNVATQDGIRSRPVFDVDGKRSIGALLYDQFATVIDDALSRQ